MPLSSITAPAVASAGVMTGLMGSSPFSNGLVVLACRTKEPLTVAVADGPNLGSVLDAATPDEGIDVEFSRSEEALSDAVNDATSPLLPEADVAEAFAVVWAVVAVAGG